MQRSVRTRTVTAAATAAVLAGVGLAAASVPAQAAAGMAPAPVAVKAAAADATVKTSEKDVNIKMRDGVTVLATAITPTTGTTWPTVILPGTYAGDGVNAKYMAETLAGRGYIVVSYIERGLGKSTGTIDAGGTLDQNDVSDVLTWTLKNTKADPARVGLASVSYGAGFIPMVVSKDTRFKAGAMLSGWGDMGESRFPNNTDALASNIALQYIGQSQGRLGPEAKLFFENAANGVYNDASRKYSAERSPINYIDALKKHNVPLYVSTSMNEMIWPADQTINFYDKYPGVKHLDVVPGDHATTEFFMDIGIAGYTWLQAFNWLDHYVAGKPNAITSDGPVRLAPRGPNGPNAVTTDVMKTYKTEKYATPEAATTSSRKLYLSSSNGFLGLGKGTALTAAAGNDSTTLKYGQNLMMYQGIPMEQGGMEVLTGQPSKVQLSLVDRSVVGVWKGSATTDALSIRGPISFHLDVTPSAANGTVFVYALAVAPNGTAYMIGHKPYSWLDATAKKPLGIDVAIPYQAFDVPKGYQLAAAVSTNDANYKDRNAAGSTVTIGPGSTVSFPLK